jgi:dUTP pyrophosphatase
MESQPILRYKKLTDKALKPIRATSKSAGLDLRSPRRYFIPPYGTVLVMTDLAMKIPDGYYGRLASRSGLAAEFSLSVGAGVIDSDYTGNIGVLIFNHSGEPYIIRTGDKVAQLICEKICYPVLEETELLNEDASERKTGGFGSSGR